ncbi:unnamed protein product [Amoebophrya sp. A25]|nr:unnamed protein product [Amoebophrya sp. A25]|eukprot:GSA25T00009558001.1
MTMLMSSWSAWTPSIMVFRVSILLLPFAFVAAGAPGLSHDRGNAPLVPLVLRPQLSSAREDVVGEIILPDDLDLDDWKRRHALLHASRWLTPDAQEAAKSTMRKEVAGTTRSFNGMVITSTSELPESLREAILKAANKRQNKTSTSEDTTVVKVDNLFNLASTTSTPMITSSAPVPVTSTPIATSEDDEVFREMNSGCWKLAESSERTMSIEGVVPPNGLHHQPEQVSASDNDDSSFEICSTQNSFSTKLSTVDAVDPEEVDGRGGHEDPIADASTDELEALSLTSVQKEKQEEVEEDFEPHESSSVVDAEQTAVSSEELDEESAPPQDATSKQGALLSVTMESEPEDQDEDYEVEASRRTSSSSQLVLFPRTGTSPTTGNHVDSASAQDQKAGSTHLRTKTGERSTSSARPRRSPFLAFASKETRDSSAISSCSEAHPYPLQHVLFRSRSSTCSTEYFNQLEEEAAATDFNEDDGRINEDTALAELYEGNFDFAPFYPEQDDTSHRHRRTSSSLFLK